MTPAAALEPPRPARTQPAPTPAPAREPTPPVRHEPEVGEVAEASQPSPPPPPAPPSAAAPDVGAVWSGVLELAEAESPVLAATVGDLTLVSLDHGQARLELADPSKRSMVERRLPRVAELIARAGGGVVTPSVTIARSGDASPAVPTHRPALDPSLVEAAERDPVVRAAMDVFDARVVDVREEAANDER